MICSELRLRSNDTNCGGVASRTISRTGRADDEGMASTLLEFMSVIVKLVIDMNVLLPLSLLAKFLIFLISLRSKKDSVMFMTVESSSVQLLLVKV